MRKVIKVGKSHRGGDVNIVVELRETTKGTELSMVGEVWRRDHRDVDQCGQMHDSMREAIGTLLIPEEKLARMLEVWKRWHLNGMKSGCEHQRAEEWEKRPIDPTKPTNSYGRHFPGQGHASWNMLTWVRPSEHPDGLLGKPCPTCGYKYGTAWLHEALPADIIEEVQSW